MFWLVVAKEMPTYHLLNILSLLNRKEKYNGTLCNL